MALIFFCFYPCVGGCYSITLEYYLQEYGGRQVLLVLVNPINSTKLLVTTTEKNQMRRLVRKKVIQRGGKTTMPRLIILGVNGVFIAKLLEDWELFQLVKQSHKAFIPEVKTTLIPLTNKIRLMATSTRNHL